MGESLEREGLMARERAPPPLKKRRDWQAADLLPVVGLCLLLVAAWTSPKTKHHVSGLLSWLHQPLTTHSIRYKGRGGPKPQYLSVLDDVDCSGLNATCGELLGIPRVALLFLSKQSLPLEPVWRLWLEGAVGYLPNQRLPLAQQAACGSDPEAWRRLLCACHPYKQRRIFGIPGQHLFSVYAHPPPWPDFKGFHENNMFKGHVVPQRNQTTWGDLSLVDASRRLLREALKDPLNERFVLVSETDIPMYDPVTLYQQLMHDSRSHIKACGNFAAARIWKKEMETKRLKQQHMAKSSQFWALVRHHAELAAKDEEVYGAFKAHCSHWKTCGGLPDEHYFATLLSAMGESSNTVCEGYGVAWHSFQNVPHGAHPRSFKPAEVAPELMRTMRALCLDSSTLAVRDAMRCTSHLGTVLATSPSQEEVCEEMRKESEEAAAYEHPLVPRCYLLGRKFPEGSLRAVMRLFLDSCAATWAKPPRSLTDQQAAQSQDFYLLTSRACMMAQNWGLLKPAQQQQQAPGGGGGGGG